MNLFNIHKQFNTQTRCIKHLEKVRWGKYPICPHCESSSVTPRKNRKYYYHCNKCNKDFSVLFGTIFESTKLPLPKWFILMAIMLNAKKGISAMQLKRDLAITYKTAWYSAMRVRCAMVGDAKLLEGIVEREGKKRVVVQMVEKTQLNSKDMLAMLKKYMKTDKAIVMTDDASFYNKFEAELQNLIIVHSKGEYVKEGIIHTNTIEGFWSIIKNGIMGQYHVLGKKYLPFYLAEFSYKYNRRNKQEESFEETIENAVDDEKCLVN